MDASKLRKGQTVRLTFEGVVGHADFKAVSLKHPDGPLMPITWSDRLNPQIEILDEGYQDGDIGVWTRPGPWKRIPVVFRRFNGNGAEGWYGVADGELRPATKADTVELVLRADGTKVED